MKEGSEMKAPIWGDTLRFKTDDCDVSSLELCIMQGGNGDWYVSIAEGPDHFPTRGVRIRTSGGACMSVPGLGQGIAKAYRAMFEKATSTEQPPK